MAGNETEGQIAALVFRAISSFESLISTGDTSLADRATAASHFARFKLWAGSLGAHRASGGRSLEYRLRDASTIKGQIVSLLQDLNVSVAQGLSLEKGKFVVTEEDSSLDTTNAELEDYFREEGHVGASEIRNVLEDIGHVVDCLLRLSITIRNPAPHDHFRSRTGANISSVYEEWDIRHTREKFPKTASGIVERLGRATAQRRQYLKYREDHTNRLAEGLVAEATASEFGGSRHEKATTIASSIPSYLKEGEAGGESATPAPSSKFGRFSDSESIASMTSYAASSSQSGQLRVPPLPKESSAGPFKCPYCCLILSIGSKQEWKKHVFRDLRPYSCTESVCTKPDQLYQRRSDWMAHMKQEHWRTWKCPFGCPDTFHSPESFSGHVKEGHPSEIPAQHLDTLQGLSSHYDPNKIAEKCPLCENFRITSEKQFGTHVGAHLEQLALFALPYHGDEDGTGDETGESKMNMEGEDDVESPESSLSFEEDSDIGEMERAQTGNHNHLRRTDSNTGSANSWDRGFYRASPDRGGDGTDAGEDELSLRHARRYETDLEDDPASPDSKSHRAHQALEDMSDKGREHKDQENETVQNDAMHDVLHIEFDDKPVAEEFPYNSIANGKLQVADLIERVIIRYDLLRNHSTLGVFANDYIYRSSETPVRDLGLGTGSRVKVLSLLDQRPGPAVTETDPMAKIIVQMRQARDEYISLTNAPAEGLFYLQYKVATDAINQVLESLRELPNDGDLMDWKNEMLNQALAVQEGVRRQMVKRERATGTIRATV